MKLIFNNNNNNNNNKNSWLRISTGRRRTRSLLKKRGQGFQLGTTENKSS